MALLRKKFPSKKYNVAFIFVSDEPKWARKHILDKEGSDNLYIIGNSSEEYGRFDLALLASCNHTIQSYGSFSYFAGFLAGGLRIVPEHFSEYDPFDRNPAKDSPLENPLPDLYFFEGIHVLNHVD